MGGEGWGSAGGGGGEGGMIDWKNLMFFLIGIIIPDISLFLSWDLASICGFWFASYYACVCFVAGVGIEGGWTNYNHPPPTPDHLSYSFFRTRPSPLAGVCYTCSRGVKPAAGVCYTCRRGLLYLQQGSVIPAAGVCYTCIRGLLYLQQGPSPADLFDLV